MLWSMSNPERRRAIRPGLDAHLSPSRARELRGLQPNGERPIVARPLDVERPYVRLIRRIRPIPADPPATADAVRLRHLLDPRMEAGQVSVYPAKRRGAAAYGGGGGSADSISGWNAVTGLPACSHADWSADS